MSDGAMGQAAAELETRLDGLGVGEAALRDAVVRTRADLSALRFHVTYPGEPALVVILGGTGTGKSTLLNRLLGRTISATSYRRTFTAGPIAVGVNGGRVPPDWLGVEHVHATQLPARGTPESLVIADDSSSSTRFALPRGAEAEGGVAWGNATAAPDHSVADRTFDSPTGATVLIDTPDLDGDQPAHHAAADRAFRWATGVVFVVTPEKYQMTELLPYYRLARRYGLLAWFVMNKAEEREVLEDYARQLATREWPDARVFAVERDDSAFAPEREQSLGALAGALRAHPEQREGPGLPARRSEGLRARKQDLVNRVMDQVVGPLRERRAEVDRAIAALRGMEEPTTSVDVNPLTEQLRVRLQQRSILYLMGPGRVWDRVRQVPGLLLRLPRSLWGAARGRKLTLPEPEPLPATPEQVPDFAAALRDQFAVVQSRIEDVMRASPAIAEWMDGEGSAAFVPDTREQRGAGGDRSAQVQEGNDGAPASKAPHTDALPQGEKGRESASSGRLRDAFAAVRVDPAEAGAIADEEVAALRAWLEQRWNANPRDTLLVMKILRHLPGGQRISKAVEAAPYLLLIFFVVHPGHMLHEVIFGAGYAAVTALMERLSNEVASRTRATNKRIADRFAELAHRQIERAVKWLEDRAVPPRELDELERSVTRLAEAG